MCLPSLDLQMAFPSNQGQDIPRQILECFAWNKSRLVRSTCAAEFVSLSDACGQGTMVATALRQIHASVEAANSILARHARRQRLMEHHACVDAKAVLDGNTAQWPRTQADRRLSGHATVMREYLEAAGADRLWWMDTLPMLRDGIPKGPLDCQALIRICRQGIWRMIWQAPEYNRLRDAGAHPETTSR